MRSYLTRNVFQRLLSNEPLFFKCPHNIRPIISRGDETVQLMKLNSRRSIFGFSRKPPKKMKESNIHIGLMKMLDLSMMDKVQARPPPTIELLQAFKDYLLHKNNTGSVVEDIAAGHVLRTFRYLRDTNTAEEGFGLTLTDLRMARHVMALLPAKNRDIHNKFAREMYAELERRNEQSSKSTQMSLKNAVQFIKVLCLTGSTLEAKGLVEDLISSNPQLLENKDPSKQLLWKSLLLGFSREQNQSQLLSVANSAESWGIAYDADIHEILTSFFGSRDDFQHTKSWFEKPIQPKSRPHAKTVSTVLEFCLRNEKSEWCKSIFRDLLQTNPDKPTWDIIFQWAMGGLGKGVEEVEQMMHIMTQHNPDDQSVRPDTDTINGLISMAMSKDNPYLAERFLTLGLKFGIRPNAKTFILQMDYRIDAKDIAGAQTAYEALLSEEVFDHEDLPVINKYIRALCSDKNPPYEKISSIFSDLEERQVLLEADTVAALCILHLKRNDVDETLNIVQVHSFHLSVEDRARIRDAFLAFCLDRNNSNMSAWTAYCFVKDSFADTGIKIRTELMNEFFNRQRADMGYHVFGHMRQDMRPEIRPTSDVYIQCFEGIASCADIDSLDLVHNMMKLDSSIEPSTRLYNALMLAYSCCGEPNKALDFWEDITISREGPTYDSIEIVFRVCEVKPFGDKPAKLIWNKMRRMGIEVTQTVFNAYVGALAGNALTDEVKVLIEGAKADLGYGPDVMTIGIFYNASPNGKREEIEEWAMAHYPQIWETLMKEFGQRTAEYGDVKFNIVRHMKA